MLRHPLQPPGLEHYHGAEAPAMHSDQLQRLGRMFRRMDTKFLAGFFRALHHGQDVSEANP